MWNQLSVPASVRNVGLVTAYLTMMAGLKITTPALFEVVPANVLVSFQSTIALSSPFLLAPLWNETAVGPEASYADMITSATSMASMFINEVAPGTSGFGLGLQDNMVYDIVVSTTGPGTATVNAHTMNVSCGTLDADIDANRIVTFDKASEWAGFSESASIVITEIAPNVLRIAVPEYSLNDMLNCNSSAARACSAPVITLFASFNISDTTGTISSQSVFNPPMNPVLSAGANFTNSTDSTSITIINTPVLSSFNVSSVSFVQCSLSVTNSSTTVNTSTRIALGPGPERKTTSSWKDYQDVKIPSDNTEYLWAYSLASAGPTTNLSSSSLCLPLDLFYHSGVYEPVSTMYVEPPACTYQTQAERYLMDKLSTHPPDREIQWWWDLISSQIAKRDGLNVSVANVMLHDLENALEDYAAAFYWSLAYLQNGPTIQNIEVEGPRSMSQLQIRILPVVTGLVLSIFLLILSPFLIGFGAIRTKAKPNIELDTLGILQILWLSGNNDPVADVEKPTTGHLRQAGLSVETSSRGQWTAQNQLLRRSASNWIERKAWRSTTSIEDTDDE
ncbi:hypothetical protein MSAN_01330900 [Mycena sanguinolenta]|uniref:Uncharacterized protein n=1 Tax=Mycena sanguinolenta TaxID=230812 RepID=A0A8H6YFJ0_9AGAR|nr:hypothetical protein MSAN_01330900 [Mycena sanguinolenta]